MNTLPSVDAENIQQLQDRLHSLSSIMGSIPVGLCIVDPELRFRFVNAWLARINGRPPEEHIGQRVRDIVPHIQDVVEPAYEHVLTTGEPVLDLDVFGETPADPEADHWWVSNHYPIIGREGSILGIATAVQNVTRIKRVEERLRHSEMTLRQVLDLVPHMIFAKDPDGAFLLANAAVAQAYGKPVEELIGTAHSELHEDSAEVRRMLEDDRIVLETGRPKFIPEEVFTDLQGNRRFLQTTKIPFTARSSGEPAVMGVAVDITDRKETELELERSREQLRELVETVQVIPWEADGETWRFTYVGPQAERILGYPTQAWYQCDFWVSHIHPGDRKRAIDFCRDASRDGGEYEFEYRMTAADGRIVWIHDLVSCELEEDGRLRTLRGYMIDVTARKNLEADLRRERNILQTIFDNIPMMVALLGRQGRVLKANRQFEKTLGWTLAEMAEIDILPLCYPDDSIRQSVGEQLEKGSAEWVEYQTRTRGGRTIDTNWSNVRLDDSLVVSIGYDITEQKKARKALEESHSEIQHLAGRLLTAQEQERRRLARELHDDFTQRLAVIAIEAGKLESQIRDVAPAAAGSLQSLTEDIVRLSGDLHSVSRQLHPSILEDLGLKEALEAECRSQAQRTATLEVKTHFDSLPEEIPTPVALCIYRVAQEGMRNAIKHSGASTVRLQLRGNGDSLELRLEDDGTGFDPEAVRNQGGLGLSSMEERVRLVGGTYRLQSHPGDGTRIEVSTGLSTEDSLVRGSLLRV